MKPLQPAIKTCGMGQIIYNSRGGFTKKIHADGKKDSIKQTGDNNPFPEFMFYNKLVRFKIGLDRYDDFLQQDIDLCKYKKNRD